MYRIFRKDDRKLSQILQKIGDFFDMNQTKVMKQAIRMLKYLFFNDRLATQVEGKSSAINKNPRQVISKITFCQIVDKN